MCSGILNLPLRIAWNSSLSVLPYQINRINRNFTIKRVITSQHFIKKNPECPDVDGLAQVILFSDKLRSHVGRCSAMKIKLFTRLGKEAKTEVNNFDVIVLVDHNVVQLYIAVSDLLNMKVLDAHYDPAEDFFGLLF